MIKRLNIFCCSWNKEDLSVTFDECLDHGHLIKVGAMDLNLPDDIIPSDVVFSNLSKDKELSVAERTVTRCQKDLMDAEEVVKKMLALPAPAENVVYSDALKEDTIPF